MTGFRERIFDIEEITAKLRALYPRHNVIVLFFPSSPEHTEKRLAGDKVYIRSYLSKPKKNNRNRR